MSHRHATISVILAASLWGTTGTVAHAIGGALSPLTIGAVTMGVGGVVLFAIAGRGAIGVFRDNRVRGWLIAGALGVAVYPLAFYSGMDLAGVAVGNILALGTGPVVGALLEWTVDRRPPGLGWWLAVTVGVAGVIALSTAGHGSTSAEPENLNLGILLALLAGVAYGVFSYAMGKVIDRNHSPLASAGSVFGLGALPLLAVVAAGATEIARSGQAALGLLYLVVFPMVISYLLYSRALAVLTSSSVLTLALVEPAVATVLAVVVVGERFDLTGVIGLVLIAISVVLATAQKAVRTGAAST